MISYVYGRTGDIAESTSMHRMARIADEEAPNGQREQVTRECVRALAAERGMNPVRVHDKAKMSPSQLTYFKPTQRTISRSTKRWML